MGSISNAIGEEAKSRVSGYNISGQSFTNDTPNLPQIIALFGEANTANQNTLSLVGREVTSADEAGRIYGYGSPIHQQMRVLRPISGDGVGGIPTIVFPQATAGGATATTINWAVTGSVTKNQTHYVTVSGRNSIDFTPYAVNLVIGDTAAIVAGKIADAVNAVLGSPVTSTATLAAIAHVTKWKGLTSKEVNIAMDVNGDSAGLTYSQTSRVEGAGAVDLAPSLAQFENNWYTTVINPYAIDTVFDALEAFNGFPSDIPTGRYAGQIFKPFMAFFGSTKSSKTDLIAITDAADRIEQCTNVLCPAPNSLGHSWEAAANVVALFARRMQDQPHLDVNAMSYPDMPVPTNGVIGDMSEYTNRDYLLKKGCSTVTLEKGKYKIQDLVTTYHKEGENPLQFNYCRNINLDFNFSFGYRALEDVFVKDRVLVQDNQLVEVDKAIKPVEWKGIVFDYIDDMAVRALISDPAYSKANTMVQINATNKDRFDTQTRYKRTGIARIESTTVKVGF